MGSIFMIMTELIKVNIWMIMLGSSVTPQLQCTCTRTCTHTAPRPALVTRNRASPIGLLSVIEFLLFALLTATQERRYPRTAVAAAGALGHRGWVGTGPTTQWMLRITLKRHRCILSLWVPRTDAFCTLLWTCALSSTQARPCSAIAV